MRIGSLFSGGVGGLELGLEAAGLGRTVWQCEIDPEARRNLRRHWPGVTQYNDVRTLNGRDVEPVDILCGGFPCVGVSSAGKGGGFDDPRSGLWREYARLIGELRPQYVVIENTPLLVTRGLEEVLRDLTSHGYDAFWFHLRASDVGAPHRRQRIFVVAWRREQVDYTHSDGLEVFRLGGLHEGFRASHGNHPDGPSCPTSTLADRLGQHVWPPGPTDPDGWRAHLKRFPRRAPAALQGTYPQPTLNPVFVESLMGVPEDWTSGKRRTRLIQLGNGVVPQVAYVVGLVVKQLDQRLRNDRHRFVLDTWETRAVPQ